MSWALLPVALAVAPKSSAMRAGLVIEKPIGSLAGAFLHRDVDHHVGALLVGADRFDRVPAPEPLPGAKRQQQGRGRCFQIGSFPVLLALQQFQLRYALDPIAGSVLHHFTDIDRVVAHAGDDAEILADALAGRTW
jgi:hypothetical protein